MTMIRTMATCLALLPLTLSAAAQEPPHPQEAEIIRQLTEEGPEEWLNGVARSLSVPAQERSPELLTAMIRGLERDVEWYRQDLSSRRSGETATHLAQELAETGDPRVLPTIAWYAYNGGAVADTLFSLGHEAIPHLLDVVMSPDASGSYAREPLLILASIVSVHGPGAFEEELVRAAALHLDGPPEHYRSNWKNQNQMLGLEQAIALASALQTPELLLRLRRLAGSTPEEIAGLTHAPYLAEGVGECARAMLEMRQPMVAVGPARTLIPNAHCDPTRWVRPR